MDAFPSTWSSTLKKSKTNCFTMPTIHGKSDEEIKIWICTTAITNLSMLPTSYLFWKQKRPFMLWLSLFTMITSFMYHLCDSVEHPIWLSEGSWHRLDNVGAITSFCTWFIYLAHIKNELYVQLAYMAALSAALVTQEADPWNINYTVGPIVGTLLCTVLKWIIIDRFQLPPFERGHLAKSMVLVLLSIGFFVKALDDQKDPYRSYHGCWHLCVGFGSYYNWTILPSPNERNQKSINNKLEKTHMKIS